MEEATAHPATPTSLKYDLDPADGWQIEENDHPIEEVRLTVDPTDNPTLTVLTWRAWVLGVTSCALLAFANTFFGYRTNQLFVSSVCIQIITLPIGRFLAKFVPMKEIKVPFTNWSFSLNPGPFSMKEHCIITIFAGAGSGYAAAIGIITIVKAFYHREIHPMAAFYAFPGFLFPSISSISVLCLVYKNSITMQQIGSGLNGLGIGSFGLDWSTVAGFFGSPLATPAKCQTIPIDLRQCL